MKTFYPAGDEQTMVQQVTGRSVPSRGLPWTWGASWTTWVPCSTSRMPWRELGDGEIPLRGGRGQGPFSKGPMGTALTDCVAEARPNVAEDYALIVGGP